MKAIDMLVDRYKDKRKDGMKKSYAQEITLCAFFVVLITLGSFIKIPIPLSPFTLQFLMTSLAGLLLGPKWGTYAVLAYVLAGLMGLPIFAEGGGPGYVINPNFGYLIGFIVATWLTARIAPPWMETTYKRRLLACLAGLGVDYAIGMTHLYLVSNLVLGTPVTFAALMLFCFVLAIPGDLFLCFVAAGFAARILPTVRRMSFLREKMVLHRNCPATVAASDETLEDRPNMVATGASGSKLTNQLNVSAVTLSGEKESVR